MSLVTFNAATEKELAALQVAFSIRFRVFLFIVQHLLGWSFVITDGKRTPAEQNKHHAENPSNPAYNPSNPGSHILGLAVDMNFTKGSVSLRMATKKATWLATGIPAAAAACGIGWGGHFLNYAGGNGDTVHFYDLP